MDIIRYFIFIIVIKTAGNAKDLRFTSKLSMESFEKCNFQKWHITIERIESIKKKKISEI